jgi:hypothetical protein
VEWSKGTELGADGGGWLLAWKQKVLCFCPLLIASCGSKSIETWNCILEMQIPEMGFFSWVHAIPILRLPCPTSSPACKSARFRLHSLPREPGPRSNVPGCPSEPSIVFHRFVTLIVSLPMPSSPSPCCPCLRLPACFTAHGKLPRPQPQPPLSDSLPACLQDDVAGYVVEWRNRTSSSRPPAKPLPRGQNFKSFARADDWSIRLALCPSLPFLGKFSLPVTYSDLQMPLAKLACARRELHHSTTASCPAPPA